MGLDVKEDVVLSLRKIIFPQAYWRRRYDEEKNSTKKKKIRLLTLTDKLNEVSDTKTGGISPQDFSSFFLH